MDERDNMDFCKTLMEMILGLMEKTYPEKKFTGYYDWQISNGFIFILLDNFADKVIFKINLKSNRINNRVKMELNVFKLTEDTIPEGVSKLRKYFNRLGFIVTSGY